MYEQNSRGIAHLDETDTNSDRLLLDTYSLFNPCFFFKNFKNFLMDTDWVSLQLRTQGILLVNSRARTGKPVNKKCSTYRWPMFKRPFLTKKGVQM